MDNFGAEFRKARLAAGVTQQHVARVLHRERGGAGAHHSSVGHIECGRRRASAERQAAFWDALSRAKDEADHPLKIRCVPIWGKYPPVLPEPMRLVSDDSRPDLYWPKNGRWYLWLSGVVSGIALALLAGSVVLLLNQ